jgi:pyruvate kinase
MTTLLLAGHKTKIVATVGPASDSFEMSRRLLEAGVNVFRLNFSHGSFEEHADRITRIRKAERETGLRVAIMADLPGPKMRIGRINPEPVELSSGGNIALTTEEIDGNAKKVSVSFKLLPKVVKPGDRLYLNDGLIHLQVEKIIGHTVDCKVLLGGELRSKKGLNLPGIDLGIRAFTDHDRECLEFAMKNGVDAVCQSFVERASDIQALREAASKTGKNPFIIAKIERAGALQHFDEILEVADGIMVARGDLGVEVPIEKMAVTQKHLIAKCNRAGKPVITATQMLESMVSSRIPTRAEATDVANAILDGTDCVMLSAESAAGHFPREAVEMLVKIATVTEEDRGFTPMTDSAKSLFKKPTVPAEAMASVVERALEDVPFSVIFVPSQSGNTARMISRYKAGAWIVAVSDDISVCQALQFSYGVYPLETGKFPDDMAGFVTSWMKEEQIKGDLVILLSGPTEQRPNDPYSMKCLKVER